MRAALGDLFLGLLVLDVRRGGLVLVKFIGLNDFLYLSFLKLRFVHLDLIEHSNQVLNSVGALLKTALQVCHEGLTVSFEGLRYFIVVRDFLVLYFVVHLGRAVDVVNRVDNLAHLLIV